MKCSRCNGTGEEPVAPGYSPAVKAARLEFVRNNLRMILREPTEAAKLARELELYSRSTSLTDIRSSLVNKARRMV